MEHQTLVALFAHTVSQRAQEPALSYIEGEELKSLTWQQFADDVYRYAATLSELGIASGDRVAHVSENRREWVALDLAIHLCQAVHVALHASLTGKQLCEQILDCEPRLLIISGAAQAEKLRGVADQLPQDLTVLCHDGDCDTIGGLKVDGLPNKLRSVDCAFGKSLLDTALQNTHPATLATILYTSGTTGEPKGVMLSHRNLSSNAQACVQAFTDDCHNLRLCWLPLSHIYARTSDLYVWLALGSQMALARSRETLLADLAIVKPTYLNGVPYFYDKLMRNVCDAGKAEAPGVLRHLLGGRISVCCAGGAALSDETAKFFEKQDVLLVQGYGLTETAPVISTGTRREHRLGTVGKPLPGVEVRIAEDGEVLTRGPHVMQGYWKKPEATNEVVCDGWFYTGDLGRLDDGYLSITGRKKEIIVLASGKNIAPALIERLLCEDPFILQAMVVGDARNYLTALIVPDPEKLKSLLREHTIAIQSPQEALRHSKICEIYRKRIDERLADLSPQEQVAKFTLLGRGFTPEHDELTPTLKLRRRQIAEHFAVAIEAMYAS